VKWYLQDVDVVFGNLEGPITAGRAIQVPEMVLRADPDVAPTLQAAGFNLLSLANNHMLDFGEQGLLDTIHYLDNAGIRHVGGGGTEQAAYAPCYMEVKGVKLAWLAFHDQGLVKQDNRSSKGPGTAVLEPDKVTAAVKEASAKADFTVVSLHAGTEYAAEPDATQVTFARLAIDAGADLVLGSHPHVVQKVEQYRGKYILYSQGNFIFDQLWSRETREGFVAKIHISANKVDRIIFLPVYINDKARPVTLKGPEAQSVLDKLGLELTRQTIPAWDNDQKVFTTGEQYVFSGQPIFSGIPIMAKTTVRSGRRWLLGRV